MCGLCGVASKKQLDERQTAAFKSLLYVSSMRGKDSTGVCSVTLNNKKTVQKLVDDSPCFLDYYGSKTGFMYRGGTRLLMGHCRDATMGPVSYKNAHPFDLGRFIGAHNGTLISSKYHPSKNSNKTDSELLFQEMVHSGIEDTLNGLSMFDAFALSIYEPETKKLYLTRNAERSLYVGIQKDFDTVFWASELAMLVFISVKHNLNLEYYTVEKYTLLEFDLDNMSVGNMWKSIDLKVPEKPTYRGGLFEWEWDEQKGQYVPNSYKTGTSNSSVVNPMDCIGRNSTGDYIEKAYDLEGKDVIPF